MISCGTRDLIALGAELPGLSKTPGSVAFVMCPDCEQRAATLTHVPGDPGCYIPRLSCAGCGGVFDLEGTAYSIGLAVGVLVQTARSHDQTCPGHKPQEDRRNG